MTEYLYDTAGNLKTVRKLDGGHSVIDKTAITHEYDRLGRRIATIDPDMGVGTTGSGRIDFVYDSLGDLRRQQTPRLREGTGPLPPTPPAQPRFAEFDYDSLGRLTERRDRADDLTSPMTSTFVYDQSYAVGTLDCEGGIGRLTTESIADGLVGLTTQYCYSSTDGGRPSAELGTITSTGEQFATYYRYDALGRLSQLQYPDTASYANGNEYKVDYQYNPRGYLERLEEDATQTVLYQTLDANARGQIEGLYLGDGSRTRRAYVTGSGRLALTNAAIGASDPVQNFTFSYDDNGNLSGRSDLINSTTACSRRRSSPRRVFHTRFACI